MVLRGEIDECPEFSNDFHEEVIKSKIISSYAKALEVIPRQLCVGFDASVLQELRKQHSKSEGVYSGVNSTTGKVLDFVSFEPADAKIKEIQSATESACKCLDEA